MKLRYLGLLMALFSTSVASADVDVKVLPSGELGSDSSFDGFYDEYQSGTAYDGGFRDGTVSGRSYIRVRNFQSADAIRHHLILLKYDLSAVEIDPEDVFGAYLTITTRVDESAGRTGGVRTMALGVYTGNDDDITRALRYDAANPLIDDAYPAGGDGDPDVDFAEGAVQKLLDFSNNPPMSGVANREVIGLDDAGFAQAVRDAMAQEDQAITFLIYAEGATGEYYAYGSEQEQLTPDDPDKLGPILTLQAIPDPFLAVNLSEAYPGDFLEFTWAVPDTATDLVLTPSGGTPIDVSGDTEDNGLGFIELEAPAATTTYTLSYMVDGNPTSFDQVVTILPPFLNVTPEIAIADETEVQFSWRILPGAELVTLEVASSPAGPFEDVDDVTFDTDLSTGVGSYVFTPFPGETHYRITYEVGGAAQDPVAATLELSVKIFESVLADGTVGQPLLVPQMDGELIYQDRTNFRFANVPQQLMNAQFLSPFNDNKDSAGISTEVTAARDATLFMLVDNRVGNGTDIDPPPASPILGEGVLDWAPTAGFVDTGLDVEGDPGLIYSIFFRQIAMGETVTFLDQADGGTRVLYVIAAVAPQVSDFANISASPLVIDEGQTTTLSWLVPAGSTVSIDQGVGPVTDDTDPTTGIGSKEITPTATGDIAYTLSYDPPGDDPEATVGPVTVTVNPVIVSGGFAITDISYDSETGAASFSWPAPEGVTDPGALTDSIERSVLLSSGWGAIPGAVITITNGVVSCSDPNPPSPKAFYRVNRP